MQRFGHVLDLDLFAVGQVGNRPAQLHHAMISPRAQLHLAHREFQDAPRFGRQHTPLLNLAGPHVGIGKHAGMTFKASLLPLPGQVVRPIMVLLQAQ